MKLFIVFFIPSSRFVLALHPKLLILVVSNFFLGVPSGFVSSQIIFPLNPIILDTILANSLIVTSSSLPTFNQGIISFGSFLCIFLLFGNQFFRTKRQASARSSTYRNSRLGFPDPQHSTYFLFAIPGTYH